MTERLLDALAGDPMARLRWRVLTRFGLPPGGAALSDADCLFAAANMVLDARARRTAEQGGRNPAFDAGRFRRLREGKA